MRDGSEKRRSVRHQTQKIRQCRGGHRPGLHHRGAGAGVAIRKEDTALRDALDAGIKAIRDNGKWKELADKHVPGVDIWGS